MKPVEIETRELLLHTHGDNDDDQQDSDTDSYPHPHLHILPPHLLSYTVRTAAETLCRLGEIVCYSVSL